MKRGRAVTAAVAVAVLAVTAGSVALTQLGGEEEAGAAKNTALPPATAPVERGDLRDSAQADGTLGYDKERKVNAGAAGTMTWTPRTGSTVERNERLYEIDGRPVRLMYGSGPMYRTLKAGDKGRDVEQLERNLADLGYTGFTPDDEYTELTAAAVKRWQKSHGAKQTGKVGPADITFAPGKVRIKSIGAGLGEQAQPGAPVLETTGSERIVTFRLDVAESRLAKTGTKVTVDLPDGTTAAGKVSSVGRTAKQGDDPQDDSPKVTLTVSFDEPDEVDGFDQSPVTVNLTGETREDVLTVPVNALLALPGGGFGLQVVRGGTVREVKVELGMFAEGRVEVSGGGLREGTKVGVPKI
ncbi:peptidoglycan-binding protein [Streptomyces griseus]|uniref:efflux RND transporter periplasmic adaptor subunit n=1 Tax=Streptomyces TaxID=1883 RepID=UPI0029C3F9D8|nr:peptidoglycan-binding protein [Streptomyces sp. ID01-9D]MDX5577811.1 peptidoglycan-binding protein [Streptomyces sp. ID01-9D]WSV23202.1 peptidoglycan-binding protein [Streptomyces fimicarius]WTC87875.1 peptidoglycan-binding protein [Streptomyces griseus]WTD69501.1 peptidoglycan-binding protein [Streptomyces griseus]